VASLGIAVVLDGIVLWVLVFWIWGAFWWVYGG
jgi:hypothetical protein